MREDFDKLDKVIADTEQTASAPPGKQRRPWSALDWGLLLATLSAFTLVCTFLAMMWVSGQDIQQFKEQFLKGESLQKETSILPSPSPVPWEQLFPPDTDQAAEAADGKVRIRVVGEGPFSVLEAVREGADIRFQSHQMHGEELGGSRADARRRVPSFNQRDFPEPESGCGPVAIVNWLLWMQNEGILRKPITGSDDWVLANYNFHSVEREIFGLRGGKGDRLRGGSNILEIAAAMDRIVYRLSSGELRMHSERFDAPLRINDWIQFTRGQRVGILIVRVMEDRTNRTPGGYHAVSLVAADRGGGVMLNNWGAQVYGTLRNEADGQFFYPENVSQPPLKVEYAVCFIPFRPEVDLPPSSLDGGSFAGRSTALPAPPRRIVQRDPAPTPSPIQMSWRVQQPRVQSADGVVFRITNLSPQANAIYLRTFSARTPSGRLLYPMDVRPARFARDGIYVPFGGVEDLYFRPGESKNVWFRFAQQEFRGALPRRLEETDMR